MRVKLNRSPQEIERLRVLYEHRGLSTAEIFQQTGVPRRSVNNYAQKGGWRRGAMMPPDSGELIDRLCIALDRRIRLIEQKPDETPARDWIALVRALRDATILSQERAGGGVVGPAAGEADADALRRELETRLERILPGSPTA